MQFQDPPFTFTTLEIDVVHFCKKKIKVGEHYLFAHLAGDWPFAAVLKIRGLISASDKFSASAVKAVGW